MPGHYRAPTLIRKLELPESNVAANYSDFRLPAPPLPHGRGSRTARVSKRWLNTRLKAATATLIAHNQHCLATPQ